jgi:hypothetical protein
MSNKLITLHTHKINIGFAGFGNAAATNQTMGVTE